jgi:hypothetical protein
MFFIYNASQPLATQMGVDILKKGGNAAVSSHQKYRCFHQVFANYLLVFIGCCGGYG